MLKLFQFLDEHIRELEPFITAALIAGAGFLVNQIPNKSICVLIVTVSVIGCLYLMFYLLMPAHAKYIAEYFSEAIKRFPEILGEQEINDIAEKYGITLPFSSP